MINFLVGLLKGLLGLIAGLLPDSPVSGWIQGLDGLQTALGWLNWCFPLGTCVGLLAVYLGLLLAWAGVKVFVGRGLDAAGKIGG